MCLHGANDSALITIKNDISAFEIVWEKVFSLLNIPEMFTYPVKEENNWFAENISG
jgi:hypothetical protein